MFSSKKNVQANRMKTRWQLWLAFNWNTLCKCNNHFSNDMFFPNIIQLGACESQKQWPIDSLPSNNDIAGWDGKSQKLFIMFYVRTKESTNFPIVIGWPIGGWMVFAKSYSPLTMAEYCNWRSVECQSKSPFQSDSLIRWCFSKNSIYRSITNANGKWNKTMTISPMPVIQLPEVKWVKQRSE